MLDLEVIPERSLGCPEKSWEFVLGLFLLCFALSLVVKINYFNN